MKVTTEMIDAAMKKATEAGLLPRHARREDVCINRELIRMVLTAALEGERKQAKAKAEPPDAALGGGAEAVSPNSSRFSGMPKFVAGMH